MMQLKPNKGGVADFSEFSGFISSKQHNGIISLTKLVVAISVVLALLMVVSR
ncbi:MAG: hypothetical protein OEM46_08265 [Ignavibacteria bacterium]|nr:hypothetical protein [Ignavibacteria bacterium]